VSVARLVADDIFLAAFVAVRLGAARRWRGGGLLSRRRRPRRVRGTLSSR